MPEDHKRLERYIKSWNLDENSTWGFTLVRPSTLKATQEQWEKVLATIRADIDYGLQPHPSIDMESNHRLTLPIRQCRLTVLDLEMPQDAPSSGVADDTMRSAARSLFQERLNSLLKPLLEEDIEEKRQLGYTEDQLRALTVENYSLPGHTEGDVILLVDSEALESMLSLGPMERWILAIDAYYEPSIRDREPYTLYEGWMRAPTDELVLLFSQAGNYGMKEICPQPWVEGQIPVYSRGGQEFVNPPGRVPPRPGTVRPKRRNPEAQT